MTMITGRMTCRSCGSPGFHKETCRSWPGKNRTPAMPEKDRPEEIVRRDEGGWISGPSARTGLTPFEAATRDLLALIAECLEPVITASDPKSMKLLALVIVGTQDLAAMLAIDEGFPDLPDAPLRDVTKATERIRSKLAKIQAHGGQS